MGTFGSPTDTERLRPSHVAAEEQPADELQKYYNESCLQTVWPCSHYAVPDAPKSNLRAVRASGSYAEYVSINKCFPDAIIEFLPEGRHHLCERLPSTAPAHVATAVTQNPARHPNRFLYVRSFPVIRDFTVSVGLSVCKNLLWRILGADLVELQIANGDQKSEL